MDRRLYSLLVGTVLACLLVPTAAADEGEPTGGQTPPPQPGVFSDALFGAVAVGEFTDDLGIDAAVLDSGILTLCMTPEVYRTSIRWDGGIANDIASVEVAGATDRLFATSASGLHELVWNGATSHWDSTNLDSIDWPNATALAVGDFDGVYGPDIVGIRDPAVATNQLLVKLGNAPSGFLVGNATITTFGAPESVMAIDWDGDGVDDVATITSAGIEVYSLQSTLLASFPWTLSSLQACVLDDPEVTGTKQRLAILLRLSPAGEQYLLTWSETVVDIARSLAPHEVISMTSADFNSDGNSDLAMTLSTSDQMMELYAHDATTQAPHGGKTFNGYFTLYPFGPTNRDPALGQAGLAAADFDHDGDLELFAPIQGSWTAGSGAGTAPYSEICVVDLNSLAEENLRPEILGGGSFIDQVPTPEVGYWLLDVEAPLVTLTPGAGQDLRLQVTLWDGPDLWAPTFDRPAFVVEQPFTAGATVNFLIEDDAVLNQTLDEILSWSVRQVLLESGEVVARGPARVGIQGRSDNGDLLHLLGPFEATAPSTHTTSGGSSKADDDVVIGGSVPEHDEDEPPIEDDPRGGAG